MKILVTGANGFLGSWICRVLSTANHTVGGFLRKNSDTYRLQGISGLRVFQNDYDEFEKIARTFDPHAVILCDWWGVDNSKHENVRQLENVARISEISKKIASLQTPIVIGVGSQAELGPVSGQILENCEDSPKHKYGEAKVATRLHLNSIFENSKTRFAWLRVFSTYGPLDSDSWLIPTLVDTLSANNRMGLTQGEQIWSYLHAYDLATAFQAVIQCSSITGIVNVGNPQTIQISQIAKLVGGILGREYIIDFGAIPYRKDQVMSLWPKCEKLTQIGWSPKVDILDGLKNTISWLQKRESLRLKLIDQTELDFKIPIRR